MKALLRFVIGTTMSFSLVGVTFGQHYTQTNLVSNTSGVAPVVDANLVNPWGLSRTSGGAWWVADNLTGVSTLYNGAGIKNPLIVTIPPADPANKSTPIGSPTGIISNSSPTDFLLTSGMAANFLFLHSRWDDCRLEPECRHSARCYGSFDPCGNSGEDHRRV